MVEMTELAGTSGARQSVTSMRDVRGKLSIAMPQIAVDLNAEVVEEPAVCVGVPAGESGSDAPRGGLGDHQEVLTSTTAGGTSANNSGKDDKETSPDDSCKETKEAQQTDDSGNLVGTDGAMFLPDDNIKGRGEGE